MKRDRLILKYQLTCNTASHCGTGMQLGLIHRSVIRDADGFLFIPGSTLKGVLRDHATRLAELFGIPVTYPHDTHTALQEFAPRPPILSTIFGSRFHPGTLYFDNAPLTAQDKAFFERSSEGDMPTMPQTDTRTRVSLSRLTGTARLQALFSSEYGVPALRFDGGITGLLQGVPLIDDDTVTYSLLLLLAALGSVEALGGDKSVGVGRVHCEVTHITVNGQARQVSDYLALLPEFETYALAEEEDAAAELAVEEGEKR